MHEQAKAHDVCIVGRLADERRIEPVIERLRIDGYTVWVPWEEEPHLAGTIAAYENLDAESPLMAKAHGRLTQVKMGCLLAVQAARCMVICQPAGADSHIQAGYAQGKNVPVVIYDLNGGNREPGTGNRNYRRGALSFDWPLAHDLDALVRWVNLYAREIPARRAGADGFGADTRNDQAALTAEAAMLQQVTACIAIRGPIELFGTGHGLRPGDVVTEISGIALSFAQGGGSEAVVYAEVVSVTIRALTAQSEEIVLEDVRMRFGPGSTRGTHRPEDR
jgi:hypothetical protein